jgi:signal peptidase I
MGEDTPPQPELDAGEAEVADGRSFWVELPGLLLTALVVAVLVKTFLVQPFYIPSESMLPTIEINDRVMVNKLAYRFGEPQPGDIVVFLNPNLTADDLDETIPEAVIRSVLEAVGVRTRGQDDLIKRVVATEGQTVEINGGVLRVDGETASEPYLAPGTEMGDFEEVTIPDDHVFVMGDNRNSSLDSRRFGPIPTVEIVGKAVLRIWPLDRVGGV